MNPEVQNIALLNGSMTGIYSLSEKSGNPMVIFIHGGGSSAGETLIPGHSQLELATRNGFSAFALNRPGYEGSEDLGFSADSDDGLFAAQAERLIAAIAEIWSEFGHNSSGIVVHGCSIGGAIALTLASQWSQRSGNELRRWPLLGVSVADVCQQPPQQSIDMWKETPIEDVVSDTRPRSDFMPTPPPWSLPLDHEPDFLRPIPRSELLEIVGGWIKNWRAVAESIAVPVRHRLAQYDSLWVVSDDLLEEFGAALRKSSPYVDSQLSLGASHGIFAGVVGDAFNLEVLAFVAFCEAVRSTPQILTEQSDT